MSEELKPCPFCESGGESFAFNALRCANFFCSVHHVTFNTAQWNNRPIEDRLRADLAAALEELATATRWQPIDTAPRDGTSILAVSSDDEEPEKVYWGEIDAYTKGWAVAYSMDDCGACVEFAAAHWLPIPLHQGHPQ